MKIICVKRVSIMSLEILMGPMFAGKSSAIQSIVRRHKALGWNVFVITHAMDTRYSSTPMIINHDQQFLPAVATHHLLPLLETADYTSSRLVVVEEAQFFDDLKLFVEAVVDRDSKHVVVVGLDGTAERKPFGQILDIVPYADRITKMTAFCSHCGDGTPAIFTFAKRDDAVAAAAGGVPCVGADEKYTPLCRRHFLKESSAQRM
jgi:thymidine kinase